MTHRLIERAALAAGAFALASTAAVASATPLLETLGPVGSTGGFNGVVSSPSAASAYFNPAMLDDAPDDLLIGIAVLSEQISLTLDGRPAGHDVPDAVGGREIVGPNGKPIPNDTVPTSWLKKGCKPGNQYNACPESPFAARPRQSQGSSGDTHGYLLIGAVKHIVKDRLTAGIYMALPFGQLTGAYSFYPDEREQLFSNSLHPELYGDRMEAISIALGLSFRIFSTLSFGIGTTFSLSNQATSADYVRDSTDYSTLLMNNTIGVSASLAPLAGLYWKPTSWLRAGFTVFSAQKFSIKENIQTTLPSGVASSSPKLQVADYFPWRAALGVEADLVRGRHVGTSIAGSIERFQWSDYLDRHGASPSTYGKDLAWSDTINTNIGLHYRLGRVRAFTDLQYAPSPVPQQIGRSNYVDNNRLGATVGGDVALEIAGVKVKPGITLVGYREIWRHQTKDDSRITDEVPDGSRNAATGTPLIGSTGLQTNNPGWPGFGSDGWVYGGSFTLDLQF